MAEVETIGTGVVSDGNKGVRSGIFNCCCCGDGDNSSKGGSCGVNSPTVVPGEIGPGGAIIVTHEQNYNIQYVLHNQY